jgi:hypothetical protein
VAKTATKAGNKRRTTIRSTKSAASPRPSRSAKRSPTARKAAGEEEVTIDRRRTERRRGESGSQEPVVQPAQPLERRQKVNRRRQIDPTTCERDYTQQEVEFMNALDDYKRRSGRMFPTCSEVLEVLRGLGYMKLSPAEMAKLQDDSTEAAVSAKPMPGDSQSTVHAAQPASNQEPMAIL